VAPSRKVAKKSRSAGRKRSRASRPAGNSGIDWREPEAGRAEPLPTTMLRWRCDPATLSFASTAEIEPATDVIGQDDAVEALRFGLETRAPGQNIFVRGLSGTGRLTLVRRLLESIQPDCSPTPDRCYVHNFSQPDRPRLISLPPRRGQEFRQRLERLIEFIRDDLRSALATDELNARRAVLERSTNKQIEEIVKPFEERLKAAELTLVRFDVGPVVQTAIFPLVEGKPVPPEEFDQLHARGEISGETYAKIRGDFAELERELAEINEKASEIRRRHDENVGALLERHARSVLVAMVRSIQAAFPEPAVQNFLADIIDDVVKNRLGDLEEGAEFTRLYGVNVVLEHSGDGMCPIVVETAPTARNLLGTIDYDFEPGDEVRASHMGIRAGALLRADGGYLILEDREVLGEPDAWKVLIRAMRTGRIEITPAGVPFIGVAPSLKPEPIEINVKVVMIGDPEVYAFLDAFDPNFPQMFKVLADFDTTIPRDAAGVEQYAAVLSRIAHEEGLRPFDRTAVAALAEHGARIAARSGKLTARFGRLADIAREAAFIAEKEGRAAASADDVRCAVRRGKRRADLPSRHFRDYVADGTIRVETRGSVIGQINGLAVLSAGPLVYGVPTRITATIGPGTAGVINIEGAAALSGAIHTKGFYILGGLLRFLLQTDHPLAFDASIALEQSYGGIDGDSASGAEICCLLSALTGLPLRQDLAMTGAIDQMGHVLAVGAVNEKIEGFFDACRDLDPAGTQGVVIPRSNAGDLMLREDVVEACSAGKFQVYPAETVYDALELLTGLPAGTRDRSGRYPKGSVLALAVARAREFWQKASRPAGGRPVSRAR